MTLPYPLVFLAQVDNTLLDNEQIQQDLRDRFEFNVGPASRVRYWQILEDLFGVLGYRDYIAALERYRIQYQREVERASLMLLPDVPHELPFCGAAVPWRARSAEATARFRAHRASVGRRHRVPAAQDRACGTRRCC